MVSFVLSCVLTFNGGIGFIYPTTCDIDELTSKPYKIIIQDYLIPQGSSGTIITSPLNKTSCAIKESTVCQFDMIVYSGLEVTGDPALLFATFENYKPDYNYLPIVR